MTVVYAIAMAALALQAIALYVVPQEEKDD